MAKKAHGKPMKAITAKILEIYGVIYGISRSFMGL